MAKVVFSPTQRHHTWPQQPPVTWPQQPPVAIRQQRHGNVSSRKSIPPSTPNLARAPKHLRQKKRSASRPAQKERSASHHLKNTRHWLWPRRKKKGLRQQREDFIQKVKEQLINKDHGNNDSDCYKLASQRWMHSKVRAQMITSMGEAEAKRRKLLPAAK